MPHRDPIPPITGVPAGFLRRWNLLAAMVCLLFLAVAAPEALADDATHKTPSDVSDSAARAALKVFADAFKSEAAEDRVLAVEALATTWHKTVAARLLKVAADDPDAGVRRSAFQALGGQNPALRSTSRKLAKLVAAESELRRKARLKALPDYPTNRFGDSLLNTPKGKAWQAKARAEAEEWLAALKSLERLGRKPEQPGLIGREFLDDPNDELVAFAIGLLGRWKAWTALPALMDLFARYPTHDTWSSVGVRVNRGGHAAAKSIWHARYGHPDKCKPRPLVNLAILKALTAITGEVFAEPEALATFLKRKDVVRKVRGR